MPPERTPLKAPPGTRAPKFMPVAPVAPVRSGPELARFEQANGAAPAPAANGALLGEAFAAQMKAMESRGEDVSRRVAMAVELLKAESSRLAEQARSDALEIGFQVARRILEEEVRTNPEPLLALIRSAIQRAGESRKIVVRVSPQDAEQIQSRPHLVSPPGLTVAQVEVLADSSLSAGDCMVDADFGTVDGRITSRLDEMKRAVVAANGSAA